MILIDVINDAIQGVNHHSPRFEDNFSMSPTNNNSNSDIMIGNGKTVEGDK